MRNRGSIYPRDEPEPARPTPAENQAPTPDVQRQGATAVENLTRLTQNFPEVSNSVSMMNETLPSFVSAQNTLRESLTERFPEYVSEIASKIGNLSTQLPDISGPIASLSTAMSEMGEISKLPTHLMSLNAKMGEALEGSDATVETAGVLKDFLREKLPAYLNTIRERFTEASDGFALTSEPMIAVRDFFTARLPAYLTAMTERFTEVTTNAASISDPTNTIRDFFAAQLPAYLTSIANNLAESIASFGVASEPVTTVRDFFAEKLPTYLTSITEKFVEVLNSAPSVVEPMSTIRDFFAERLPAYLTSITQHLTETMASFTLINEPMSGIRDFFIEKLPTYLNTIKDRLRESSEGFALGTEPSEGANDFFSEKLPAYLSALTGQFKILIEAYPKFEQPFEEFRALTSEKFPAYMDAIIGSISMYLDTMTARYASYRNEATNVGAIAFNTEEWTPLLEQKNNWVASFARMLEDDTDRSGQRGSLFASLARTEESLPILADPAMSNRGMVIPAPGATTSNLDERLAMDARFRELTNTVEQLRLDQKAPATNNEVSVAATDVLKRIEELLRELNAMTVQIGTRNLDLQRRQNMIAQDTATALGTQ
jgi:hypothetical protein